MEPTSPSRGESSGQPETDRTEAPGAYFRASQPSAGRPPVPPTPAGWRARLPADWRARCLEGFLLGALFGLYLSQLGISSQLNMPIQEDILLLPGLIGVL